MLVSATGTRAESQCSRCACSSLPPALVRSMLLCLPPRPATCSAVCNGAAMDLRLTKEAWDCSTVRGGRLQVVPAADTLENACRCDFEHLKCILCCCLMRGAGGLKVRARDCLWHWCEECVPPRPGICKWWPWQRPAIMKPRLMEQSFMRLLDGVRQWRPLCLRHLGGECLPPRPATFRDGSDLEQACGCSTVRGGLGLKVRARLCLQHSRKVCGF